MENTETAHPKILIVDDDPVATPLLKLALKSQFSVCTEAAGSEALATAISFQPYMILLDLHMPNVDGYEVLKKIKTHPGTASIPVICMSGDVVQESRDRATQLGAVGYFQKPLDLKRLASDIHHAVNSLNVVMESKSKALKFNIAFNQGEKYRLMRKEISERLSEGRSCVVLSLLSGEDFLTEELKPALISQKLIYLQIIPSLIAKFPYLQDLTPITDDIQEFTLTPLKEFQLFFDDPNLLLGRDDVNAAYTRLHSLKELFLKSFRGSEFFVSREGLTSSADLNEFAALFCR